MGNWFITDFLNEVIGIFNIRRVKYGERFKVKINVGADAGRFCVHIGYYRSARGAKGCWPGRLFFVDFGEKVEVSGVYGGVVGR